MTMSEEERPKVLIVDDEDSVRSALRRTLRKEKYKLFFASSAAEALELLRNERVDLVISDHLMPEVTGIELLKRCRLLYPDMGRVVLTGQAEIETVVMAINDGEVYRFLRKPWDDDEVKLTVHLALRQVMLERENKRLLQLLESQARYIKQLEGEHPGIASVKRDSTGAILIDDDELAAL